VLVAVDETRRERQAGAVDHLRRPVTEVLDLRLLFTDFWPNVPDPLDWLGIAAVTGGSFNQSGYSGIDADYAKAVATQDDEQRATLVGQMMTKLTADMAPMAPGISHSSRLWMNKRISGAPASFSYVYYPWAAFLGGTA
jgi:peptide/nickel transport system substrate-binding protein